MAHKAVSFLLFLLLPVTTAFSDSSPPFSESSLFDFAEHLLQQNDFDRAVTEFKRYLFLYPSGTRFDEASYLLGAALFYKKEFQEAVSHWERTLHSRPASAYQDQIRFMTGKAYWELGREDQALAHWEGLIREGRPDYRAIACRAVLWALVKQKKWERADQILRDSPLQDAEKDLHRQYLAQAQHLPYASPAVAGLLAGVLPGAGHWYLNRKQDACVAFIVNGLFAWAAVTSFQKGNNGLGTLLTVMELAWYSGTIYSAVNSAHKHNRKMDAEFLDAYSIRFGFLSLKGKGSTPYLAFHFLF